MWLSLFKKTVLPERQSKDDKWAISSLDAIKKYGSATAVMEELFKDFSEEKPFGWTDFERLMFLYLREQHYKNVDDGK